MSEIASGARSAVLTQCKPAISEHAQEHAPRLFSPAVLDKLFAGTIPIIRRPVDHIFLVYPRHLIKDKVASE